MKNGEKKAVKKKKINPQYFVFGIILAILLVLIAFFVYANFFHYKNCESLTCFNDFLETCNKAKFQSSGDLVFEYQIDSKTNEKCFVEVKLINSKLPNKDAEKLVGKKMVCAIPNKMVISPESDLANCHGLLKEGLQDLIIQKLHTYIVKNLGEINKDLFG